ncbi:tyrosine-type recombinase/integrase [Salipiger bermudensis]|uniref:tyrosine-type recombinase/integrase n=2 Tax=Roseobacteraceae TaxID=2854170 RepID=UPI0035186152
MKLPRYVQRRPSGLLRYKRNVPKRLIERLGHTHVYRNLGHSYEDMIKLLPKAHAEVEALFRRSESETSRERTLAIVESHFGTEAAEMLAAGKIDENLEYGLWALHQELEDEVDSAVIGNLAAAAVPTEKLTLKKAFDLYAEFKDADENKKLLNSLKKTQEDLQASMGVIRFGKFSITELTREDALKYRDYLLSRVAPNSVSRYINIVRAVVNHVIDERGLVMKNPFQNLKVKGAGNTATDRLPLSPDDADRGYEAMSGRDDLRTIYLALWETGARMAEITGLEVQDVNLQERQLHIRTNAIRGLKTASSARLLPISDDLVHALQQHRHGMILPRFGGHPGEAFEPTEGVSDGKEEAPVFSG